MNLLAFYLYFLRIGVKGIVIRVDVDRSNKGLDVNIAKLQGAIRVSIFLLFLEEKTYMEPLSKIITVLRLGYGII